MLNFKSNITYYLSSIPTDMRKGREGLAEVVREKMQRDPYIYGDAFIFYSKNGVISHEQWVSAAQELMDFKYNTEYIHAALSLEKKLVVMLYKEGSRSHEIPEEKIFKGSMIECFTADRAPLC